MATELQQKEMYYYSILNLIEKLLSALLTVIPSNGENIHLELT